MMETFENGKSSNNVTRGNWRQFCRTEQKTIDSWDFEIHGDAADAIEIILKISQVGQVASVWKLRGSILVKN